MKTGMRQPEVLMNGGVVGNATANEIAAMSADIQAWANKEHDDDGGHLDITARTLQVAGASTVSGDQVVSGALTVGTTGRVKLADSVGTVQNDGAVGPGIVINMDCAGGGPQAQIVSAKPSFDTELSLLWRDTPTGTNYRPLLVRHDTHVMNGFVVMPGPITNVTQPCYLGSSSELAGAGRWSGAYLKACDSTAGYKEHGRSVASGDWAAVTYAGSNFTASGATLTVEAADVVEHKVSYNGYTLRMKVFVQAASTSGAGATELDIAIPGGFTAKGRNPGAMWLNLNGTYEWGTYQTSDGGSVIKIFRQDPSTTYGAYANSLGFRGEIEIEINA
jgi:hypothetical protein